jgi:hypothetical protein
MPQSLMDINVGKYADNLLVSRLEFSYLRKCAGANGEAEIVLLTCGTGMPNLAAVSLKR